jgi:trehalose 6-phosphate phosphatase
MKHILNAASREVVAEVCDSKVLLGFDFDGTLAPITHAPEDAQMGLITGELLAQVAALYPSIVISGRSRSDVRARLGDASVWEVVGNHGAEPWPGDRGLERSVLDVVDGWFCTLADLARRAPGVEVEYKRYSISIHYRRARFKAVARSAIENAAAELSGARVIRGKQVVNLVPIGVPHKGEALERSRRSLGCDAVLYVGDDETDEDVFAHADPARMVSIRVGRRWTSRAVYHLKKQSEIDALLELLIERRAKR